MDGQFFNIQEHLNRHQELLDHSEQSRLIQLASLSAPLAPDNQPKAALIRRLVDKFKITPSLN